MTKVCHITSVHPLNDTRIFIKECRTLVEAGYDVTLIVQNDKDEVIEGVKVKKLDKPKNRKERMINTIRQAYRTALECDADIYHFHDPELIPVGLRLKRKGKKIVYDVHEDLPQDIMSKEWIIAPLRRITRLVTEKCENFAVRRFDCIVTATPYIRDRFRRINQNTMDINNFPLLTELYEPNSEWGNKEKVVCYVGGIAKVRGIFEIINAIGKTKCSLLLAGRFESEKEREICTRLEGWNKVIDFGYLDREGVKHVLSRAMAGIVLFHPEPNHIHAQPNKMFEYMSAGIPVIASNFPLWKEIVEGNNCGICVDPLNIDEIAEAINWIVENPEQAKQMGENGRRAVEKKYNWENEKKKLLRLYEELSN